MTSRSSLPPWSADGATVFSQRCSIHFSHCDPAGIVFFPQYFVLLNNLVENWFTQGLGIDYAHLIGQRRVGLPTVALQCEFIAPSRMGEQVDFSLQVQRIGSRSLTLKVICTGTHQPYQPHQPRLHLQQVLVSTSLDSGHAIALPPDVLNALTQWNKPQGVPP